MPASATTTPSPASPWLAALLSLPVPGLGQYYLGRPIPALFLHLGWLGLLAIWALWAPGSFAAVIALAAALLLWAVAAAIHAAILGRPRPARTLAWHGRWPVLAALALLANGATELALLHHCPSRYTRLEMSAASMEPTLRPGESVVADLTAFRHRLPARRELVVLASPEDAQALWVMRCVGVPGDLVEVRDRQLLVNGVPQKGPHLPETPAPGRAQDPYHLDQAGPVLLQDGQLYCLGDNWENSLDSRYFGPMPVTAVRGRPLYRLISGQASRLGRPLD